MQLARADRWEAQQREQGKGVAYAKSGNWASNRVHALEPAIQVATSPSGAGAMAGTADTDTATILTER